MLHAETVRHIFQDNADLCQKVTDSVVQHFVHAIQKERHVKFLYFLQTVVKAEETHLRRIQDMVMQEVSISLIGNGNESCILTGARMPVFAIL